MKAFTTIEAEMAALLGGGGMDQSKDALGQLFSAVVLGEEPAAGRR